jgi:SAM-dependent methyltransferase
MTVASNIRTEDQLDIPVIDYENSQYKADFWIGQGRDYEDKAERLAIQELLPRHGLRVAEIGAGFGRLADLYQKYEQVILFDYSRTLLQDAVNKWGNDPRFIFVAGNIYQLPLATASLDSLLMVRVMHHLADVPQALQQIERVLHKRSVAVLEYANKRNLKAIARWLLRRQTWSPFQLSPLEFIALNFDFHPKWMSERLIEANLSVRRQLAVSHFRLPLIKKRINAQTLAQADSFLFELGGNYPLAPSVFVQTISKNERLPIVIDAAPGAIADLFCCPRCRAEAFQLIGEEQLLCTQCAVTFAKRDGIWDFKDSLPVKGD